MTFASVQREPNLSSQSSPTSVKEDRLMDDDTSDAIGVTEVQSDVLEAGSSMLSTIGSVDGFDTKTRKRVGTPPACCSASESSERSRGKRRRLSLITNSIYQLTLES